MDAVVVRIELDPLAANVLAELVEEYLSTRTGRLLSNPPVHTRARLEEQRETGEAIQRELVRAIANPVEVEVP